MMDLPLGFRVSGCFGTKHPIKKECQGLARTINMRHTTQQCAEYRACVCALRAQCQGRHVHPGLKDQRQPDLHTGFLLFNTSHSPKFISIRAHISLKFTPNIRWFALDSALDMGPNYRGFGPFSWVNLHFFLDVNLLPLGSRLAIICHRRMKEIAIEMGIVRGQ